MSFSDIINRSDCTSHNKWTHLLNHFSHDHSLQNDHFTQAESSQTSLNRFRTGNDDIRHFNDNKFESQFFQQKDIIHTMNHWVDDYEKYSESFSPLISEYEQLYQPQAKQSPNQWANDFHVYQSLHQQPGSDISEEEQMAFDRAFDGVDDGKYWDKEFASHEQWELDHMKDLSLNSTPQLDAKDWSSQSTPQLDMKDWSSNMTPQLDRKDLSSQSTLKLDMKDWTEEFSKYHDLANQERLNMTRNNGNQDWIQQYKKNIIDRKLDKQWHHKTRAWDRLEPEGKPYGYRTIHPEYQTYNYIQNNPYLTRPHAIDAAINNTLADAIMALEAKTQLDPHDAKAWEKLGLKQQENERDAAAITALEKAVSLDPTLLDAWMGLAVGYINEHCRMDSYNCLEQWIVNNQRYKSIVEEDLGAYYSEEEKRHDYITHLFLKAARTMPGEEMDADVQVGLGVLFNMSEEYDKAIDCFRAALISRPEDYQLWNKVGATLANSRDSVGAIEMYFNALQINPSFVRARYNIAISHMNLGQHKEAAEYLLSALALQQEAALSAGQAAGNIDAVNTSNVCGTSDSIWSSLRLLMYMISREDLAAECDHHNLDAFRSSFDF